MLLAFVRVHVLDHAAAAQLFGAGMAGETARQGCRCVFQPIVRAIHPGPLPRPDTPELVRQHFRLLRQGLAAWMAGSTQPQGLPSHAEFTAGVVQVLDHVRRTHGGDVLIVSSGGPIATAVAHVLGTPAATTIDLNMRIRNSALTEFAVTPKRHALLSFDAIPHLETPEHAAWVT